MRRDTRKQPWQTFPFWFLILSGMAMTVAWKLDLLRPKAAHVARDVAESEQAHDPDWASEKQDAEPVAQTEEQSEPILPSQTARTFPESTDAVVTGPSSEEMIDGEKVEEVQTALADAPEPAAEPVEEQSEPLIAREKAEPKAPVNPFAKTSELRVADASHKPEIEEGQPDASTTQTSTKPRPQSPFGPAKVEFKGTHNPESTDSPAETADAATEEPVAEGNSEEIVQTAGTDAESKQQTPAVQLALKNAEAMPVKAPARGKPAASVDLTEIDQLISNGEDVEANFQLSNLYWKRPELRSQLEERLRKVSYSIYFAPQPHYMDGYVVKPGDALQRIAKEYNVSWEYLAKLNRTDPKKIRPGQTLKVIRGPFSAVVDLSDMQITIHSHGHYVHSFAMGIGRDSSSPQGTFKVLDKQRDPTYYGPDGVIEHDDPQNPLGEYWIDLGDSYGIHGTIDESSIGKSESKGCIRMRNRDIADVYDLLTIGSEVLIRR